MTPYRIETARLSLRCHDPRSAEITKRAEDESRSHLATFLPWAARGPETLDEVVAKLRIFRAQFDDDTIWAYVAHERSTGAYAGSVSLRPLAQGVFNVGYWVHTAWLRQGLATEMTRAMMRMAFDIKKARTLVIRCLQENVASARVAEAAGFSHRAVLPAELARSDGEYGDAFVFTMLRAEFEASDVRSFPFEAFDVLDRACPARAPTSSSPS